MYIENRQVSCRNLSVFSVISVHFRYHFGVAKKCLKNNSNIMFAIFDKLWMALSILVYLMVSRVFLANLEIDLVRIKSIFFFLHLRIIRLKSSLFFVEVPVMPSSAKMPAIVILDWS